MAWILSKTGVYVLGIVAVVLALAWAHHYVYRQGWQARDAVAQSESKAAKIAADKETARLQQVADAAHQEYVNAQSDLESYRASHPIAGRQLCNAGAASNLPPSSPANGGNGSPGPAAPVVQPVPPADHGFAGDRFGLLSALGALCDTKNDALREWQSVK